MFLQKPSKHSDSLFAVTAVVVAVAAAVVVVSFAAFSKISQHSKPFKTSTQLN
jgi:hypothetical protein